LADRATAVKFILASLTRISAVETMYQKGLDMNALIVIAVLLGAEPVDRQLMVDEMLSYVYMMNGSEPRQATESRFEKLSDKEIRRMYTDFKRLKLQMEDLFKARHQRVVSPEEAGPEEVAIESDPEIGTRQTNSRKVVPYDDDFCVPAGYRIKNWGLEWRGNVSLVYPMSPECKNYIPGPYVPKNSRGRIVSVTLEPIKEEKPIERKPCKNGTCPMSNVE